MRSLGQQEREHTGHQDALEVLLVEQLGFIPDTA